MPNYPRGFQPVPRDPAKLPFESKADAGPEITIDDVSFPESPLITQAKTFLKPILGEPTWNHSHRSFLFASAIAKSKLSSYLDYDAESLYLACLFHDIGCTPENIKRTRLSFEIWGGLQAHQWLAEHDAPQDLVDAVTEAVVRHTDFNEGKISCTGQLIQIGTLFDNLHAHAEQLPPAFVNQVVQAWPRPGWAGCFAGAMQNEVDAKPWAHATELRESDNWPKITGNELAKSEK